MIHYFCTRRHAYTIRRFAAGWDPNLMRHLRVVPYERLPFGTWESGTCILSDLERILPWERPLVVRIQKRLAEYPEHLRLWNNPIGFQGRFEFMRKLFARGWSDFRAFRLDDLPEDIRYPVFVRCEFDHEGARTPLLYSREELMRAIQGFRFREKALTPFLIAVEFCETRGEDGLYRKYSAMKLGHNLVPRHLMVSSGWMIKKPDIATPETVREEQQFIEEFPHRDQVESVFREMEIDYGRVDYGVKDGRIQVWEINTNPMVVLEPGMVGPAREELQARSAAQITEIFRKAAEAPAGGGVCRPFSIPENLALRGAGMVMRGYSWFKP